MTAEQFIKLYKKKALELFQDSAEDAPCINSMVAIFYDTCMRAAELTVHMCEDVESSDCPDFMKVIDLMKKMLDLDTEIRKQNGAFLETKH